MLVVIIGAGLSGLTCAFELNEILSRHGIAAISHVEGSPRTSELLANHEKVEILILEAQNRIGGRLFSEREVDLGGSWVWPAQDTLLCKLAKRVGIGLIAQPHAGIALEQQRVGKAVSPIGMNISPAGDNSFRFVGGAGSFISSLASNIDNFSTIRLQCTVHSIEQFNEQHAKRININFMQVNAGEHTITADAVVLAIPPQLIAETILFNPSIDPVKLAAMKRTPTWMSNSGKIVFIYKSKFWTDMELSGTVFSQCGPMRQIWDASSTVSNNPVPAGEEGTVALAAFVFDQDLKYLRDPANIRNSPIWAQMMHIFGPVASNPIDILCKSWIDDPYCMCQQRRNSSTADSKMLSYGNHAVIKSLDNIFFAGTETAPDNGHMNGAVRAGLRAAQEAAASIIALRHDSC
jgi:monoamine oxidase